jgi:hypothetical protein
VIGAWSRLLSYGRQATRVDIGRPEPHDAKTPAAPLKHIGTTAIDNRCAIVIYKTLRTVSRPLHPRIRRGGLDAPGERRGMSAGRAGPGIIKRRSEAVQPRQPGRPDPRAAPASSPGGAAMFRVSQRGEGIDDAL